jgi:MFS family permease
MSHTKDLSEKMIGVIFSMYYLGLLLFSLYVGRNMGSTLLKRRAICRGLFVMFLGNLLFLSLIFVKEKFYYVLLGCLARFVTGSGEGMFISPAFSLIPQFYKDSVEKKIGLMEAIAGFGLSVGPLIGGLMY